MFGNFFNNMYYGKGNRPDFTAENLPKNRWALFWDMLRVRFTGLIQLNMQTVLFSIPMLIWTFIQLTATLYVLNGGDAGVVPPVEQYSDIVYSSLFYYFLLLIPCLVILGPGIAGLTNVTQQWARDDHAWATSDFWAGVKGNWKQAMGIMALNGMFLVMFHLGIRQYGLMAQTQPFFYFLQALMYVLAFLLLIANLYVFPLMVTYELKFMHLCRNAILLAVARLPQSILFGLSWLFFPLIVFLMLLFGMPTQIVFLIALVILMLVGLAFPMFVTSSYTNAVFDKYINPRIQGAPINRGLRKADDDDEETKAPVVKE